MTSIYEDTLKKLHALRAQHEDVAVAFSGGKDSIAVMDLAVKVFRRVYPCYYYFVPGLKCVDTLVSSLLVHWPKAEPLRQYPSLWGLSQAIKYGYYTSEWIDHDDIREMKVGMFDVDRIAMRECGVSVMLNGYKLTDSMMRRRFMKTNDHPGIVYAIAEWNKWHVLSYLRSNDLPTPETIGARMTGDIGNLATSSLLWLHDNHPEDFETLSRYFPFIPAVVYRRKFYGLTE